MRIGKSFLQSNRTKIRDGMQPGQQFVTQTNYNEEIEVACAFNCHATLL